ncbi:hypothetical protein [Teredinibacter turnerae]|uniref:hypothetical protein n=1 Tax=Teredinibacter turnerae TaxID=2426 RepID=UPI00048B0FDA|nr:hypothetical protein [Teredinibacter turnerae]
MQTNEPKSNISEHPTLRRHTKISAFEAARVLEKYRLHPSHSVSICMDGHAFRWARTDPQAVGAGALLTKEIKLWADAVGHKSVENLLLCYPFQSFEPYELTGIMHALASHFGLSESEQRVHRVVTHQDEVNSDHIALLKGLGFNHYQIALNRSDLEDLDKLKAVGDLIRKYAFTGMSIQIHDSNCLDDLREHVIEVKRMIAPDFIYIGNRPKLIDNDLSANGGILFDGECELENNCIYMGLEGKSHLQHMALQNFCTQNRYLEALQEGKLPINHGPTHE